MAETTETTQVKYWISGMVGGKQVDCQGPLVSPVDDDMYHHYPFTTVEPNSNYTYQRFDYAKGEWEDTSSASIGQQITDLQKTVATLDSQLQTTQDRQDTAIKGNTQTNAEIENLTKMMAIINANVGKIGEVVTNLSKASNEETTNQSSSSTTTETTQGGNN